MSCKKAIVVAEKMKEKYGDRLELHTLRPWVCYLFPFSYGGEVIHSCPAHVEHRQLLDCLVIGEKEYNVYDSSFCPNLDLRPIPEDRWLGILKRFQSAPSLAEMAVSFVAFNEPELMGEGMAIHGFR